MGQDHTEHLPCCSSADSRIPLLKTQYQAIQGHQTPPPTGPYPVEKRGPDVRARGAAPGSARQKGGPGAHHCAPRWSVVLIKAPSSDFWVSTSGRSREPRPSAILARHPGPAGPDIRPAHGVLWDEPTHARTPVRVPAPPQVAASSATNFCQFSPPPRAGSLPSSRGGAQRKTGKGRATVRR